MGESLGNNSGAQAVVLKAKRALREMVRVDGSHGHVLSGEA